MYIFVKIFFSLAWTMVDADVLKLPSSVSSAAARAVKMILMKIYDYKQDSDSDVIWIIRNIIIISDDYISDDSDLYKHLWSHALIMYFNTSAMYNWVCKKVSKKKGDV